MLLIYGNEQEWEGDGREACFEESIRLTQSLRDEGKYLAAAPLHLTASAKSVRIREGQRLVTDGPFAETREQLGGYYLVDARDMEEAVQIAARIPGARRGTVEVRPVFELTGLPKS